MEDYFNDFKEKRISKRKVGIVIAIILVIVLFITIIVLYNNNLSVRQWIDVHILRKEIMQNDAKAIEIPDIQNSSIYSYSKYVGVLNKNKFDIYTTNGEKNQTLDIQILNPIFNSTNRFLIIAEEMGQNIYVVEDTKIIWETEVEGNISQVYINENGYVGVIITGTTHESIIVMYDSAGKELFKTYLSATRAVDISISKDNKFLAVAEVDTSGTVIQSSVKIVSVENAINNPTEAIQKTYTAEPNKLIINLEYQNKNKLICMYNDLIVSIENEQETVIQEIGDKKVSYQSIDLNNSIVSVEEKSTGLFTADSYVHLINLETNEGKEYIIDSVIKEIYSKGNVIGLNLGTQIEFINKEGSLVKRYISYQEITNITLSENIAVIIYNDKIEIINL